MTEDEMVGWHHQLNGYESEQTPGDGEGQGAWFTAVPGSHKESDITKQLNNLCFYFSLLIIQMFIGKNST